MDSETVEPKPTCGVSCRAWNTKPRISRSRNHLSKNVDFMIEGPRAVYLGSAGRFRVSKAGGGHSRCRGYLHWRQKYVLAPGSGDANQTTQESATATRIRDKSCKSAGL